MKDLIKKIDIRHYISVFIILLSIIMSILFFRDALTILVISIKDLGNSIAIYFITLFDIEKDIQSSFMIYDFNMESILPYSASEFFDKVKEFFILLVDKDNLLSYLISSIKLVNVLLRLIMFLIPVGFLLYFLVSESLKKQNNNYNQDTKPLKIYKIIMDYTYRPFKRVIVSYINFLKQNKYYLIILIVIWAYSFNLISIVIMFLAFFFYFSAVFNFKAIYVFIVKFFMYMLSLFKTVPLVVWLILGLYIFDIWRKCRASERLRHLIMKNRGFINSLPLVNLVEGIMQKGKTKLITDMVICNEMILRHQALESMIKCDMMFPDFPWINLEKWIQEKIYNHEIYNLSIIEREIKKIEFKFKFLHLRIRMHQRNYINKWYRRAKEIGIKYPDFCFGYDLRKGLYYNDKLKNHYLFDVLQNYAKLYYIFIHQTSLIISNYSIRSGFEIADKGNLPRIYDNLFSDSLSPKYSHILDFDFMRLGKKVIDDNPNANFFEFGTIGITEIGKERGNFITLKGVKNDDKITNQRNDLFNDFLKLIRHPSTVMFYSYVKVFCDEQRATSWEADAKELTNIIHIIDESDERLILPFSFLDELLYDLIIFKFFGFYKQQRFLRGDNTLFLYLYKSFSSKIYNYYHKLYNQFGFSVMKLEIEAGTQDKILGESNYYLCNKKIYADRYATDAYSDVFRSKSLNSKVGLNDIKSYKSSRAEFDELMSQNSYFINKITKIIDDDTNEFPKEKK